ncbi:hypothetical protein [Corallococcus sp. AB018]|uniref:hypothetical protein n=1 Tax=Corallococcus sp. AB018 TaxID=2316715 RepID=UPI000F867710|nr:hypothetical protein [Corallococcus sp. AB018]
MELEIAPDAVAAHEAGHAIVALACGIPVKWVEVRTTRNSPSSTQYGWTEALEDSWMVSAPLPKEAKLVRRLALKAGGLAGELAADVSNSEKSIRGAESDIRQIGAALCELGLLERSGANTPPAFIRAAVGRSLRVLEQNFSAFDDLRKRLLEIGRVESPTMLPTWTDIDDQEFMEELEEVNVQLSGVGRLP